MRVLAFVTWCGRGGVKKGKQISFLCETLKRVGAPRIYDSNRVRERWHKLSNNSRDGIPFHALLLKRWDSIHTEWI